MLLTFFVHLNATRRWLSLSARDRERFVAERLGPILGRYPEVAGRFYDAEAFSASPSDIAVFEAPEPEVFAAFWDEVRDTEVFTAPFFEVVGVYPAFASDAL